MVERRSYVNLSRISVKEALVVRVTSTSVVERTSEFNNRGNTVGKDER
jgi:hypothetical protein